MVFFNIPKRDEQKTCARVYRICKCAFLIFQKADEQKIALDFLGFVSMLF